MNTNKTIVISQPMFFPWIGMFEQIRLADIYVHYDDVQFSKGSFVNRVQIKTAQGIRWLTVPLSGLALGQAINETRIDDRTDWRRSHLDMLAQAYSKAPFAARMLELVKSVYAHRHENIGELAKASLNAVCDYYGLRPGRRFLEARELGIGGAGSRRVFGIVKALGGDTYVTGWGARNYLDHQLFEDAGISVKYMSYQKTAYPQLHGEFTPYVSILDLIANLGADGVGLIRSGTVYWKDFLNHE